MGNAFSNCSGSAPALTASSQNNDQSESSSYGCFNKVESAHLLKVQQSVCEEIKNVQEDVDFIGVVWKHAHSCALSNGEGNYTSNVLQRCEQLQTVSTSLKSASALSHALMQKFITLDSNSFVEEFVSNLCSGAYGNKTTLDFVWEVCCCDGSTINMKDKVPAENVIHLLLDVAELAHCMLMDDAFEMIKLKDERNSMIQSLTSSVLDCATNCPKEFGFSGSSMPNAALETRDQSINKRGFMEWQRKVVPDIFHNSFEQFVQILLFPPKLDTKQTVPLFRAYKRFVPSMLSSKEMMPRTAAKLKEGEVVPMKSAVFGPNHSNNKTSADSTGQTASTLFVPEVFVFTAISASKFGSKVSLDFLILIVQLKSSRILRSFVYCSGTEYTLGRMMGGLIISLSIL